MTTGWAGVSNEAAGHKPRRRPMKTLLLLVAWLVPLCVLNPAHAIDPGVAQGSLQVDGTAIPLKHAYVQLHDNAEKLLDRPKELRILLADREVPQSALDGIAFLPATHMAREGKLRGLLIQLDPGNRKAAEITVLNPPPDPTQTLVTQSVSGSQDAVRNMTIANNRVSGEVAASDSRAGTGELPKVEYRVKFSAPLFNEPAITADLSGKAAQESPQIRALRERARALAKLDMEALRRLSTARAYMPTERFFKGGGDLAKEHLRNAGNDLEKQLNGAQRVVVRGERAVVILSPREWMTLVREGGVWRSDD